MKEYELYHHGVLGMRWGVRKGHASSGGSAKRVSKKKVPSDRQVRKAEKKATLNEYRSDKGPKRFGVLNAANSAARSYYRQQRAKRLPTYRDQGNKRDLKEARLTDSQIKNGRYRVARARSIKRNIASVAVGVAVGSATAAAGAAAISPLLGAAAATGGHFATGAHFYGKQRRAYGGTRAKYQNQKKAKNKKAA